MVSRDGGLRPAVPLPAVAILLRVLLRWTRLYTPRKACTGCGSLETIFIVSLAPAERNWANGVFTFVVRPLCGKSRVFGRWLTTRGSAAASERSERSGRLEARVSPRFNDKS